MFLIKETDMKKTDDIQRQFKRYQTDLAILISILGIVAFFFVQLLYS